MLLPCLVEHRTFSLKIVNWSFLSIVILFSYYHGLIIVSDLEGLVICLILRIEKKMVPNLQVCNVKLPPPSPKTKRSNNGKIKLTIATNGSQKVKANIQWQPKVTATDRITKQNRTHHLKKSLLTPSSTVKTHGGCHSN